MALKKFYVIMQLLWGKFIKDSKQRIAIYTDDTIKDAEEREHCFSSTFKTLPVTVTVLVDDKKATIVNFTESGFKGESAYSVERYLGEGDYTLINRLCFDFERQYRINRFFKKETVSGVPEVCWWDRFEVIGVPYPSLIQEVCSGIDNNQAVDVYLANTFLSNDTAQLGIDMDVASEVINAWQKEGRDVYALLDSGGWLVGFAEYRTRKTHSYTIKYEAVANCEIALNAENGDEAVDNVKKMLEAKGQTLGAFTIVEED